MMTATAAPTIPFQPAERDCILGQPDDVIKVPVPDHGINRHGDDIAYDFVRDDQLAELAEGLIERYAKRYGMLEKIDIVYGWARELPDTNGSATLIKLKKADAFLWWAINDGQVRGRFPHVYVLLNRLVAGYAELTMWQTQAAIHTALECITIARGKVKLAHPASQNANLFIARRYGAWSPDLQAIGAALRKAESEQLPLFEEADEDEDEEGEGDDE